MNIKNFSLAAIAAFSLSCPLIASADTYECSFLNNTNWRGEMTNNATGEKSSIMLHLQTRYIPEMAQLQGTVTIGSASYPFSFDNAGCISGAYGGVPEMLRINLPYNNHTLFLGYAMNSSSTTTMAPHWFYVGGSKETYTSSVLTKV